MSASGQDESGQVWPVALNASSTVVKCGCARPPEVIGTSVAFYIVAATFEGFFRTFRGLFLFQIPCPFLLCFGEAIPKARRRFGKGSPDLLLPSVSGFHSRIGAEQMDAGLNLSCACSNSDEHPEDLGRPQLLPLCPLPMWASRATPPCTPCSCRRSGAQGKLRHEKQSLLLARLFSKVWRFHCCCCGFRRADLQAGSSIGLIRDESLDFSNLRKMNVVMIQATWVCACVCMC